MFISRKLHVRSLFLTLWLDIVWGSDSSAQPCNAYCSWLTVAVHYSWLAVAIHCSWVMVAIHCSWITVVIHYSWITVVIHCRCHSAAWGCTAKILSSLSQMFPVSSECSPVLCSDEVGSGRNFSLNLLYFLAICPIWWNESYPITIL